MDKDIKVNKKSSICYKNAYMALRIGKALYGVYKKMVRQQKVRL